MVVIYPRLILLLAGTGLAALLFSFSFDPMKAHAKLLRLCVTGLGLLMLWNALPLPHLGVNPLSALVAGALGAPGLGLLAVLAQLP